MTYRYRKHPRGVPSPEITPLHVAIDGLEYLIMLNGILKTFMANNDPQHVSMFSAPLCTLLGAELVA